MNVGCTLYRLSMLSSILNLHNISKIKIKIILNLFCISPKLQYLCNKHIAYVRTRNELIPILFR